MDLDAFYDLRSRYDELFKKRIEEVDLPEEMKTLPGQLFIALERELYRDLLVLRKKLGISEDAKVSNLGHRKRKRSARRKGERGKMRVIIYRIRSEDNENKGVA